jgi:hypothetical protein
MTDPTKDGRKYWLDDPRNVTRIFWSVWIVCGLLFVADAFYDKHPHFTAEGWFGFYGIFGFVACVGLVLAAKALRVILKRPEDYYDK